jgi:hypothetical protein
MSAWNLFYVLNEIGDFIEAKTVLEKYLLLLLDRDPVSLEVNQLKIREMIIQLIETAKKTKTE